MEQEEPCCPATEAEVPKVEVPDDVTIAVVPDEEEAVEMVSVNASVNESREFSNMNLGTA